MNKEKLIQIITKDLEELKTFTEDIAESQDNSTLIVDLALSRSQLIGKEFEILRQLLLQAENLNKKTEIDFIEEDEEDSVNSFSDPELEIINFEEPESEQPEEFEEDEPIVYNSEEEDENFGDNDDLTSEEEIEMEVSNPVEDETIIEEEDDLEEEKIDEDDLDDDFDDEDEENEGDEDELVAFEEKVVSENKAQAEKENAAPQAKSTVYMNELKFESPNEVREIHIEDMDDEEEEPVRFSPQPAPASRPVMHEIPKPEFTAPEKVVAETFQKDRSLNDTIAENKSEESSLGNGPIASLKASIGLNDRFLFIREIFANNTDKYNMVIDQLDKLETIQQAVEFLKAQLTLQKNETSLKFVELLKRRFSK